MTNSFNRRAAFLFCGDVIALFVSLWLSLFIRYQMVPSDAIWQAHVVPFSILFVVWIIVFYSVGLYEKRLAVFKKRLSNTIIKAHIVNCIIAASFFYFIPYFQITPKTTLFIYLIVSLILIIIWRVSGTEILGGIRVQNALLIATGPETQELLDEVNTHHQYNLRFVSNFDLESTPVPSGFSNIIRWVKSHGISVIVVDFGSGVAEKMVSALYRLMFSKIVFVDFHTLYEDIFDRIPLSLISAEWVLENISLAPRAAYDLFKRVTDILIAACAGLISLIFYPFIMLAILLDDHGSFFIAQERVGKDGKLIRIYKFRSMSRNVTDLHANQTENHVTRVGHFLRASRLDELPQLWNVLKGDLSLIGPRPELPSGVEFYEKTIPYYGVRHLIKPGLSGWAQIYHDNHPHHTMAVDATKEKLSYDLYYLKNRSLILDIKIALKTLDKLLSRSGA